METLSAQYVHFLLRFGVCHYAAGCLGGLSGGGQYRVREPNETAVESHAV